MIAWKNPWACRETEENPKKDEEEMLEINNTLVEMKNVCHGLNNTLDTAEEKKISSEREEKPGLAGRAITTSRTIFQSITLLWGSHATVEQTGILSNFLSPIDASLAEPLGFRGSFKSQLIYLLSLIFTTGHLSGES